MMISIPVFLGIAPSFIWLLFFLRKDRQPEPNRMILKIFVFGMIITLVAAFVELGIEASLNIFDFISDISAKSDILSLLTLLAYNIFGIALIEEFLKYLVIKEKVLKNPNFDEPVDAMLYMIISALGFAALENILIIWPIGNIYDQTSVIALRFVGATFLHALCSGVVGYFLALSFYETKRRFLLISVGIAISSVLHGLYNFSIIKSVYSYSYIYIAVIVLAALASFVSICFKSVKEKASVCKILPSPRN